MVPLIPRKVLFENPEKLSPQISPDGMHLAFLAPDSRNVLQIWWRSISGDTDELLTADPKRGIRSFFWTCEPGWLVYLQDTEGDENFHLFGVNVGSREVRDLTPYPGVRAEVVAVEPHVPGELLVALNKEDRRKMDVYRVKLSSGEAVLDTQNPGHVIRWVTDADLQVRAALAARPDGGHEIWWRSSAKSPWETLVALEPDDEGSPIDFSEDGQTLYLVSSQDAEAVRLLSWNAATRKFTVLAEDAQSDISGALVHPTRRVIQAVSFQRARLEWQVLDPDLQKDFKALRDSCRGDLSISRTDLSDQLWLISDAVDNGPARYVLYDRRTRTGTFLFSQRKSLESVPLASMKPIEFKSRDGLTIHGYLTLPLDLPVSPSPRLPTVLLVHGGPWARDRWGFNPMVQWLANRGYAMLQLNYRGSTGYGKRFLNAGNREWAGKMHHDLIDGVKWLIDQGISDPQRIAIMGGSYGGYATLVGLTFTPEVFACGVDIVGPSNLITLVRTIPPYWEPMRAMFARRLGGVDQDETFMKARSPLFHVDKIQRPLLIGRGANDPRVKQAESDQIVKALRDKGKPVEYWVYTDEGHGFFRPPNRLHFYSRIENFLAQYLGGRAEPVADEPGHAAVER
jgi:dipeptidyl aminopeptidase/acylaminoacyl peptidase